MEDTSDINLRALLKADFGVEYPISGGTGNSRDSAVVIHYQVPNDYVAVEYAVLRCQWALASLGWLGQVVLSLLVIGLSRIRTCRISDPQCCSVRLIHHLASGATKPTC